jgi:3'(2'), 5'-bisphosphate nucleotidase
MAYEAELQAALEAADQAGQAVLRQYVDFQAIPDAPASISTDADRLSQSLILKHLDGRFPGDAFCAEEMSATGERVAGTGPRLWVIDPIDGTRGFAKKVGEFSIMVAFVAEGQLAVGVVLEPAKGRLTYAVRGGGCWKRDHNGSPEACRVSDVSDLKATTIAQSHKTGDAARLGAARVVETYSAGIKLALVARGEADIYISTYTAFHDWDLCAGVILVEEAGGQVTGLTGEVLHYGRPGALQSNGLLATNRWLHEAAIEQLRAVR